MSTRDVRSELERMTTSARLDLIELVLKLIRQDLKLARHTGADPGDRDQMAVAAAKLQLDYATDEDLTAFTVLDAEDFHATR